MAQNKIVISRRAKGARPESTDNAYACSCIPDRRCARRPDDGRDRYSEISGAPSGGLNGGFSGACEGIDGNGFGVIDGTVGGASITGGGGNGPRGISAAGILLAGG